MVFSHGTIPDCYSASKPYDYTFHHITAATTTAIMVISFSGVRETNCNKVSYTSRTMCVLQGTSVDISCTYTNYFERWKKGHEYWINWSDNQEPRERVTYPVEDRGRSTLRITDLRVTDSAEYRFTFKSQWNEWNEWKSTLHGTTLTVTGTTDC